MENDKKETNYGIKVATRTIRFGLIVSSIILAIFFLIVLGFTVRGIHINSNAKSIFSILAIIIWILLIIMIMYIIGRYFDCNNLKKCIILISIFMIVPRILLIVSVRVIQTSDFRLYMDVANSILNTLRVGDNRDYLLSIANNVVPISSIFALWFALLGSNVFSALLLNLLLFIGSGYLFYFICREITTSKNALISTVLYVLWPEFIFYQVVVASEYLYMFFSMLGIHLIIRAVKYIDNFKKTLIVIAVGAISLSISNAIRPIGLVIAITCIIYIIYYYVSNKLKVSKMLSMVGIIIICFIIVSSISNKYTEKILNNKLSTINWGWSLYEGTNTDTWGGWSAKTSKELDEVRSNSDDLSNVQSQMFNLAIERLRTYDAKTMLKLIKNKSVNMWGSNDYAIRMSIAEQDLENSLIDLKSYESNFVTCSNNLWYGILLVFAIANIYFTICMIMKKSINMKIIIFATPITGILLIHCMLTAISRYKYPAIPFMIMFVTYFLGEILEGNKCVTKIGRVQ